MARVVVIGAGTSGLVAAVALARAGHGVKLLERDPRPEHVDATNALTAWRRPGTPQALLPHGFMALARDLLAARMPDVLAATIDAGALVFDLARSLPGDRVAADDELRVLFCRRPLFEAQLWRAVEREESIELRAGTAAAGLLFDGKVDGRPRVVGVRTATGEELRADVVIDACGRRSPVWTWLVDAGAPPTEPLTEECGLLYFSRYFALHRGASLPAAPWLWGPRVELPYAFAIVHLADRGVFSVTFCVPTHDHELRVVREPSAFDAVCAALPPLAPWVATETAGPISPVLAMGGLQNVLRPFVRDLLPLAVGLLPIGDTFCHTNAAYGWGVALGIAHALAAADALDAHSDDPRAMARAYHARVWPEAEARWRVSSEQDRARGRLWRGETAPMSDAPRARTLAALMPAAMRDAHVFRAAMRFSALLDPADALLGDVALHERARAVLAAAPPVARPPMPTRAELLAVAVRAAAP